MGSVAMSVSRWAQKPAAVADRFPGRDALDVGDARDKAHGRPQRQGVRGIEAVERNPRADAVVPRLRIAHRGGGGRGVALRAQAVFRNDGEHPVKARELLEGKVALRVVRGGAMRHGAGDLDVGTEPRRLQQVAELFLRAHADAVHARVDLQMRLGVHAEGLCRPLQRQQRVAREDHLRDAVFRGGEGAGARRSRPA